jgi:hypothetical protein
MLFDACGPFDFPRNRQNGWRRVFWEDVEYYIEGLSSSIGCYAFGLSYGNKSYPWYVGMTTAQKGFRGEIFEPHKLAHYDEILLERRGKPTITLFPLVTENWNFSQAGVSSKPTIEWLERTLIGMALSKNPDIRNVKDTKLFREVYVNGIMGGQFRGRRSNGATFARSLFVD